MIYNQDFHKVEDFVELFNQEFFDCNTRLQAGADEPFYQAPAGDKPAIIFSSHDYFSSALHECAHWCIAGEKRRQIDDYGYWYAADGRTHEQQQEFFKVEQKPQALEWAFALASNLPFRLSLDNLNNPSGDTEAFREQVFSALNNYFVQGFPPHARRMIQMLCRYYRQGQPIQLPDISACSI